MIDDQNLDGAFGWLEFQSELLLHGDKNIGSGIGRNAGVGGMRPLRVRPSDRRVRRVDQVDFKLTPDSGLIYHRAAHQPLQDIGQEPHGRASRINPAPANPGAAAVIRIFFARRNRLQMVAGLAVKTGDPARGITAAQVELEIDRQMLKQDPKDVNAQLNQGLAFLQIGQAYEARAGKTRSLSDWRQADSWDRKSVEVWERIQKDGHLNPRYAAFLTTAQASIAKCKKALGD